MKWMRWGLLCLIWIVALDGLNPAQGIEWKGRDWSIALNGALRVSYNRDDCGGDCISGRQATEAGAANEDGTYLSGNVSHIAIQGARDTTAGIKAVFRSEWGLDPSDRHREDSLTDLEQFIGLDGGFGLLRAGTLETPYMQSGNLLDPFYRDAAAARFFVDIQSALHHSTGKGRGRATNSIRYDAPTSLKGLDVSLFVSLDETDDNDHAYGGGVAYRSQNWFVFAQYYDNGEPGDDEAYKVGAKISSPGYSLFGQYEFDNGLISLSENIAAVEPEGLNTAENDLTDEDNETTGADLWLVGLTLGTRKIMVIGQYGEREDADDARFSRSGHKSWLVGARFELDAAFYLYTGYLEKKYNSDVDKDKRFTVGATLMF